MVGWTAGKHPSIEAILVWMSTDPLVVGKSYLLRNGPHERDGRRPQCGFRVDVNTLKEHDGDSLDLNEIGLAVIETSQPLCFDPYRANAETAAFRGPRVNCDECKLRGSISPGRLWYST